MKKQIYPSKLELEIRKNKYIPRQINKRERLKLYHKYYLPDYGIIKVEDIELIEQVEYDFIRYDTIKRGCITHPVDNIGVYELLHNFDDIDKENIINSSKTFSGAEIKFWFVVNKINFDNPNYKGFYQFLDPLSNNLLVDTKYYYVIYNTKSNQPFQIILDKKKK